MLTVIEVHFVYCHTILPFVSQKHLVVKLFYYRHEQTKKQHNFSKWMPVFLTLFSHY